MLRLVPSVLLVGLLLAASSPAQNASTPAAILDKALQAAGGEAKLAKLQGLSLKAKGLYRDGSGKDLRFTGTWYYQGLDKQRSIIEVEAMGAKSQELRVINGERGWSKQGMLESEQLDKDDLAEEKDNMYLNWLTMLAPLKSKDFKLAPVAEVKVEDRPAAGFTVTRKGQRDVKMYFDRETGLLAKTERQVKDADTKKEVTEEMFFSNYKDVDGIKLALRYVVKLAGKLSVDMEIGEAKAQEKLDDKLFTRP